MTTNITACMLTLNEEGDIGESIDSVHSIVDELVILDGGSDDNTVSIAEEKSEEYGLDFQLIESSEREYLLEGPGTQRRRMENIASNEYTLQLGADVIVDVLNEDWFHRDFNHIAYAHNRQKPGGYIMRDYRLYSPTKAKERFIENPVAGEAEEPPRWRGLIHEEIRTKRGHHIEEVFAVQEAPMVHYQKRHGAMDTHSVFEYSNNRHDLQAGGNMGYALKKQHYLLKRAMCSTPIRYLSEPYKDYYLHNRGDIQADWWEIIEEYDLPMLTDDERHWAENESTIDGFDLTDMDPVMDHVNNDFFSYVKKKATGKWRQ